MADAPPIEDAITIRAPRSAVFKALTDSQELAGWMATTAESDPRPGGRFKYVFEFEDASQNNEQAGEYLAVEREDRVALPWVFPFAPDRTRVEYVLSGDDETEVRFTHSGFKTGEPWDSARERFIGGWHLFLESLKSWVENRRPSHPLGIQARGS